MAATELMKLTDFFPIVGSLNTIGINITATKHESILKNPIKFTILFMSSMIWAISMIAYAITYHSDFDRLVEVLTVIVQHDLMIVKICLFLWKRQRFLQLNKNLENLAKQGNAQERALWNAKNKRVKSFVWTYMSSCIITGSITIITPLMLTSLKYFKTGEIIFTMPFPGLFPFDKNNRLFILLTYVSSLAFVYFAIFVIVAVDGLFFWFVHNISAHLSILHSKLQSVAVTLIESTSKDDGNLVDFHQQFVDLVIYHRRIISLTNEFDNVFCETIFIEVMTNCLQLCFLAYQLAYTKDLDNVIFVCMLFLTVTIQLGFYCFGGQKIQDDSLMIADSIYLIYPWCNMPSHIKRLFHLPLMRSQVALKLTGYFFAVDRDLLVWIFRTAGSFTALLFAMKEKEV